jgi:nicotinamidase-related amidase/uncharacterized glyoxalase superfamily protein PhnB
MKQSVLGSRVVPSLLVRDLDESLRFYEHIGFSVSGYYPDDGNPVWAEIRGRNVVMQLYTEPPRGTPDTPVFSGTLYVYPDDVNGLAAELADRVDFEWGPETMPYGMREFAVRDPNGYLLAFTGDPGAPDTTSRQGSRPATASPAPALLLIDVQQGLDAPHLGERNNPGAERVIAALLGEWRTAALPVIHVQHLSLEPDSTLRADAPGCAFKPEAEPLPGEPVFQKHVNSAFIGTPLDAYLHEQAIRSLVVVGLTTDHCVSTTVRMAGNLGYDVTVVEDATATFERRGPGGQHLTAGQMHAAALASLDGEFARVSRARDVLERLGSLATLGS